VGAVELASFAVGSLSGVARVDDGVVAAQLRGTASVRDIGSLETFLAAILVDSAREVRLDLRQVVYMNSSHFKTLVAWLGRAGKQKPPLPVRLRGNRAHHWQKRGLEALKHLAEDWVTVDHDDP
jgi:hypothetical protein